MNGRKFLLGILCAAGLSAGAGVLATPADAFPISHPVTQGNVSATTPNVAIATPEDVAGVKIEQARWHRHYHRRFYHRRHYYHHWRHHRHFYRHHRRHRFYY